MCVDVCLCVYVCMCICMSVDIYIYISKIHALWKMVAILTTSALDFPLLHKYPYSNSNFIRRFTIVCP